MTKTRKNSITNQKSDKSSEHPYKSTKEDYNKNKNYNKKISNKKNINTNTKGKPLSAKQIKRKEYYTKIQERSEQRKPPICKYFIHGCCKLDDCTYSHDVSVEQMKKFDEPCKYYPSGECNKGVMCCYLHETFPCQFYHNKTGNRCNKSENCLFSHSPLTESLSKALEKFLISQENRYQVSPDNAKLNEDESGATKDHCLIALSHGVFGQNTLSISASHLNDEEDCKDISHCLTTSEDTANYIIDNTNIKNVENKKNVENFGSTFSSIFNVSSVNENWENEKNISNISNENMNILKSLEINSNYIPKFTKLFDDSDTEEELEICENTIATTNDINSNNERFNKPANIVVMNNESLIQKNKSEIHQEKSRQENIVSNTTQEVRYFLRRRTSEISEPLIDVKRKKMLPNSPLNSSKQVITELKKSVDKNPYLNNFLSNSNETFNIKNKRGRPCKNISLKSYKITPLVVESNSETYGNDERILTNINNRDKVQLLDCSKNQIQTVHEKLNITDSYYTETINRQFTTNEFPNIDWNKINTENLQPIPMLSYSSDDEAILNYKPNNKLQLPSIDDQNINSLTTNHSQTISENINHSDDSSNICSVVSMTILDNQPMIFEDIIPTLSLDKSIIQWSPPLLILEPKLTYHQMEIDCYNLPHKFDDPRIRNHRRALKTNWSTWFNT